MSFIKRIGSLALLARVIARAVFRGAADTAPDTIKTIIVVPTGKLGDIVCSTPVFAAVRANFPKAKIIAGGNSKLNQALLSDSGLVDEYLEMENKGGLVKRIKQCRADVALLLGPSFELAAPLYLSGIPFVVAPRVLGGFSLQATKPYRALLRLLATFPYRMGEYAPRERLRALEPLGVVCEKTEKHLGFSAAASANIDRFFAGQGINPAVDFVVGLTPTAGHKIKEWPEERFARVADYLAARYKAKVVVVGGPNDRSKVAATIAHMHRDTKAVEATSFSIDELKAFVSKLHLFVSVDTGPIYIAEAFGVPTIDITGPIDEREQPPRGALHRSVVPPQRTSPELFVLSAKRYNRAEALRQVDSITVPLVQKEIDILMKNIGRS